jgi:hypothetical protein
MKDIMKVMKMDNFVQRQTTTPHIAKGALFIQAKTHPDKPTRPQATQNINITATRHLENVDDQDADTILQDIQSFVPVNV